MTTHRNHNGARAFVLGGLIGGLAGAVIALLRTPQSGQETRDQIREKSLELKAEAEQKVAEGKRAVEESIAHARETVAERLEQGRSLLDRQGEALRSTTGK